MEFLVPSVFKDMENTTAIVIFGIVLFEVVKCTHMQNFP